MTKTEQFYARKNALRKAEKGRLKAGTGVFTEDQREAFNIGFNMGWDAKNKTRIFKEQKQITACTYDESKKIYFPEDCKKEDNEELKRRLAEEIIATARVLWLKDMSKK